MNAKKQTHTHIHKNDNNNSKIAGKTKHKNTENNGNYIENVKMGKVGIPNKRRGLVGHSQ